MPHLDPNSAEGREWLKTTDGMEWLDSDEGVSWLVSGEGEDWLGSRDGRAWTEARQDASWNDYISGNKPTASLPDWALTPETAPQVGMRVRFVETDHTMSGIEFRKGELGIVTEARFTPMGVVVVEIRTLDGRKRLVTMRGTVEPAT
jgi:hypothetical protein